MTNPSPISGLAERLRAKIAAIPETDRGFHYEAADYLQRESIHAYGPIARMCMFVIDNAQALVAELAALASPLPVAAQGGDQFESSVDGDTPLEAAAREAGWALMELVDYIDWTKREQVSDIISRLGQALSTKTAAPLGVATQEEVLELPDAAGNDEMALAALPIPAPDAQAVADDDPECTDCGGAGITYQTERPCACQPRLAVVKPLVWNEYNDEQGNPDRWDAETPLGPFYSIELGLNGFCVSFDSVDSLGVHLEVDDAKAAAQADYEQRIRSALAVPPSIPDGGVAAAPAPEGADGPSLSDETYYTKGKDCTWFENLSDEAFAWEATKMAQDLADMDTGSLESWLPFIGVMSDAADRIKRLATPASVGVPTAPEAAGGVAVSDAWQPIETAPKDGTYFIGFWPHASRSFAHHQGQYRTCWTGWGGGCWEADALGRPVQKPTHWMPLPAPPAALSPEAKTGERS